MGAAVFIIGSTDMQLAAGQHCIGCAKEFAPAEDPKIPGWDPDRAEEDAPGQFQGDDNFATKDVAPGQLKQKEIEN
jgi:hypothetical protein